MNLSDQAEFADLLGRHTVRLVLFIRRVAGRALRADYDEEDVFQTVACLAWQKLPEFEDRGPGSFYRWLATLARHAISNRTRYLQAKGRGQVRHMESDLGPKGGREPLDPETSVSTLAERREAIERMHGVLIALSREHREVLELHLLEGLSFSQISTELGITKSTAWGRLEQGLARIKRLVGRLD